MKGSLELLILLVSANIGLLSYASKAQVGTQPEVSSQQRQDIFIEQIPDELKSSNIRDLILLQEYDPWFIEIEGSSTYTDNAFLSNEKQDDIYFKKNLNIGYQTKIAEKFDVRIQAEASLSRYLEFTELDSDSLGFSAKVSTPVAKNIDVGLDYSSTFLFERNFGRNTLDLHNLSLFAKYQKSISDKTLLYSNLSVTRTFANPSDFENFKFEALAGAYHQASKKISIGGGLSFSTLLYDDYFEEITGESREDFKLTPFAYIAYSPSPNMDLSFSMQFSKNSSSLDPLDYSNFSATPQVRFTYRF